MAWLQKRPSVTNPTSFYTVGLHKTVLIVGLGNPGEKYNQTRHNIGYECIDNFLATFTEMGKPILKKDLKCIISTGQIGDTRVLAIKPTTYMNDSGESVSKVTSFYKIESASTLIVHDDLDIEFGDIRTRVGGSSAGHNGIKSISILLGDENYGRLRIGIKNEQLTTYDPKDFVLEKFSQKELSQLPNLKKEVVAIISEFVFGGGQLQTETRSFIV